MSSRLSLALASGVVALPERGRVLLLRPPADIDLSGLPSDEVIAVHGFKPDHDALASRGLPMASEIDGPAEAAVVFATRAKALTHDLLAQAAAAVGAGGPIIVDGAKADGIDSLLKRLRGITQVGEVFSKAHGKCFQITAPQTLPDDWRALPRDVDGFRTAPGVFSADGVDPGSALLVAHLDALSGRVCDLGAGWGYLSSHILAQSAVTEVTLVEAEALALDCARVNVADPRARFHWADATRWEGGPYDAVVMNPPFHTGRKADPALGRSFVQVASRLLTPRGRLIMVANRHLPYEATLAESFGDTMVRADQGGYKVIEATRPKRRPT